MIPIEIVCEGGHSQTIRIDATLGADYARNFAGLLDGTSDWYKFPPGPESVIGKCGICSRPVKATVGEPVP